MSIDVRAGGLERPDVRALLREHLRRMTAQSPPGSVHALDLDALRTADVAFFSAREGDELLGVGALKDLGTLPGPDGGPERWGELKSMRVADAHLGRGVGAAILARLTDEARGRGIVRLGLETGRTEDFRAARELYARRGFVECAPFGSYVTDPFSVCMSKPSI